MDQGSLHIANCPRGGQRGQLARTHHGFHQQASIQIIGIYQFMLRFCINPSYGAQFTTPHLHARQIAIYLIVTYVCNTWVTDLKHHKFKRAEKAFVAATKTTLHISKETSKLEPVAHTAFSAAVSTLLVDLRLPTFSANAAAWRHPTDYSATQAFARTAREAKVGGIQYLSVRDPQPAWCVALLTPQAFAKPKPHPLMQTWWLAVHQDGVTWRRDNESMTFAAAAWQV